MSATSATRFEQLLSSRAQLGRQTTSGVWPTAPTKYEFGGGKPDPGSFPYDAIVEATGRMMAAEGAQALTYGEPLGYRGMRELIAHKHELFEGLKVGSGHALSLVISAFVDIGDAVICEAPTFSGTLNALRRHGADLHGVPIDDEGIIVEAVRAKLEELRRAGRPCKLIYTLPTFHNPAGPTATVARRKALVAVAQEYGTMILEDDAYGELRFEGETLPSLYELDESDGVIRAGTFSKTLGAGMRLGWLLTPQAILPSLQAFNFGGGVAPFTSRVATYYMRDHMESHVAKLIDVYRAKRDAMLQGLWEVLEGTDVVISRPTGGFFIWIKLPEGTDTQKLGTLAREAAVGYVPGNNFMPNGGAERYIRLAYSYESEENCHSGARYLASAIREAMA